MLNQYLNSSCGILSIKDTHPSQKEQEIDPQMIKFAKEQGLTNEHFLQGKMSQETLHIFNDIKL